jgi:hypothetical protein
MRVRAPPVRADWIRAIGRAVVFSKNQNWQQDSEEWE